MNEARADSGDSTLIGSTDSRRVRLFSRQSFVA